MFLSPIALLILFGSLGFVQEAYQTKEISMDPGGLTHRWILKAFIPFSFGLLFFGSLGFIVKNINLYKKHKSLTHEHPELDYDWYRDVLCGNVYATFGIS